MLKKIVAVMLVALALVMVVACGGGDSTEEPSPTPTETAEPTASPTADVTPTPTQTTSPTPTADNTVESVLDSTLSSLIVAYAEVDGLWEAYRGTKADTLTTLKKGGAYWIFCTEEITPSSGFTLILSEGWQQAGPIAWMSDDEAVGSALAAYGDNILFVVGYDEVAKNFTLYINPSVLPMTEIQPGQEYCTFAGNPPAPKEKCQTR